MCASHLQHTVLMARGNPLQLLQVIFCATARSQLAADLTRVDDRGIINIAKALQVNQ